MRAWIAPLLIAASAARADGLHDLALDREATPLLDGALAVRLVDGAQLDGDAAAHIDWGEARLVIVARDLGATRAGTVRDRIARVLRDDGEACAPIERLALGKVAIAFAATPRVPRRLVYAAFAADRGVRLFELAFYGDASLAPLASRIAATLVVREPHAQPRPSPLLVGSCELHDRRQLRAREAVDLDPVDGSFRGENVTWSVWRDHFGFRAEAVLEKHVVDCFAEMPGLLHDALNRVAK